MKNFTLLSFVFSFFFLGAICAHAQVVTKIVDDGTDGTLRVEIAETAAGGTVTFDPSIQGQQIDVTMGAIPINTFASITIDGNNGGQLTTISAGSSSRIFDIDATIVAVVNLNSLILRDGSEQSGGAILASGGSTVVNIQDSELRNNEATGANAVQGGGAIFNDGAIVNLTNCLFTRNDATGTSGSGGAILNSNGGSMTIDNSIFRVNTSQRAGGAIEDNASAGTPIIVTNSTFARNDAGANPGNGGALHVSGSSSYTFTGATIRENVAGKEGGGLWNNAGTLTINSSLLEDNVASGDFVAGSPPQIVGGGAIFSEDSPTGEVVINEGTIIRRNFATGVQGSGGGILMATGTTLTINGTEGNPVTISNNSASRAGGGLEDWSLDANTNNLTNVVFSGNTAGLDADNFVANGGPGNGGAIHVTGPGSNNITGGSATGNLAANEGGGFWNGTGTMTISGTTIDGNTASGNDADVAGAAGGGGIFNEGGTVDLIAGTVVSNNIADGAQSTGGGVLNAAGTFTATDSEISGNESNRAGGGIETNGTSSVTLTNVTLENNSTGVVTGMGAPGNGGALHVSGAGSVDITGGTVNTNDAANEGGGLWNGAGTMTVSGTTINANIAAGTSAAGATNPGDTGGGGIYNEGGTVNLTNNAVVSNNQATGAQSTGGGVLNAAGTFTATDSEISGNESNRAGGGIETNGDSSVELTNTNLDGNFTGVTTGPGAPGNGGGLHVSGAAPVTITGGTVNNNIAAKEGGGLWNNQGTLTVNGTELTGNDARGDFVAGTPPEIVGGGAIFAEDGAGIVIINEGTTIDSNFATGVQGSGGGILMATGTTLTINGTEGNPVTISNNSASRAGGGLEDWSLDANTNNLTNVVFSGNTAGLDADNFVANGGPGNGGAIHVTGPGSNNITGGSATGNLAANEGGGFWNGTGTMTISGTTIDGNTASGNDADVAGAAGGGGIFNEGGTVDLIAGTVVSNNIADGAQSTGGGVLNAAGTFTATDSEISGNESNRAGGGIETNGASSVTLTNVTLDNNSTGVITGMGAPGNGGALHVSGAGSVDITGGTVNTNDAANEGGGLWNGAGIMTVDGTTIDGNTASGNDPDVTGASGGGGIYNEGGTVNLTNNAVISNNIADGAQSTGGGVLNAAGTFTATDSEISGNESNRAGGGIETNGDSSVELTNTNLDGNFTGAVTGAGAPGNGGGLHVSGAAPVTITGGTVNNNIAAKEGGGLWNNGGLLTINGTTLSGNDAQGDFVAGTPPEIVGGGAIFSEDSMTGSVVINEGTIIDGNVATGVQGSGGGILMATGTTLTINGTDASPVTISNNSASRAGGGIEDWSLGATTSTITNVNFTGNTAGLNSGDFVANGGPGNGGAIHITGPGLMDIIGGTADSNMAAAEGGAFWNNIGTMSLNDVIVSNNTATGGDADNGGGGLFNNGGTFNATNVTVTGNLATGASGSGGALLSTDGAVTITDSEITGNSANRAGGAIEIILGTLDINTSDISGNDVNGNAGTAAPGNGGALHISASETEGATVTIDNSTFNNNAAASEGGALWNQTNSTLIVSNSTLDSNSTNGTAVDNGGGAIFNNGGDTEVYDTTISNNTSASNGGGISNQIGTLIVETSTISSNSADLDGAGVYNAGTSVDFDIVTIAQNTAAGNGGGLASASGAFSIRNTLVGENQASSNLNVQGITSNDYNLIEIDDTNSFTTMANDIVGTVASPEFASLGPLQDNGGNTFTHALENGTRAQDQGEPGNNLTDQRGFEVFGAARDIGSYEAQVTLSNDDVSEALASVRMYPNPSSNGQFNIELPAQITSTATYRVMDMTGKVVGGSTLQNGVNRLQMNNLSTGIYIVQISVSDQQQSLKLIIE